MAHFKRFVIVAALAASSPSFAFYAGMSPPPGVPVTPGPLMYQASAADVSFSNGIRAKIAGSVNVGTKAVSLPVAFKYATGAAAAAAKHSFNNPWLFVGILAATAAYDYYADPAGDLVIEGGVWKKKMNDSACSPYVGTLPVHSSNWSEYWYSPAGGWSEIWGCYQSGVAPSMMWGWTIRSPSGAVSKSHVQTTTMVTVARTPVPITETDYVNRFMNQPLPRGVPQVLPVPLPVELPIINPTPAPSVDPARVPGVKPQPSTIPAPVPQPMRVPQGDPQPLPYPDPANPTAPQKYRTPITEISPSPVLDSPWRVDVQPKDIVTESPTPFPDGVPQPVPLTPPAGETVTPSEKIPGLCDLYPDILACQKLDTPSSDDLTKVDKPVSVTADSGWGASSAACPAPRPIGNRNINFEFNSLCNGLGMLKPIILAVAWLSAGLILLGVRGGD